jgi:hypothetical protein
VYAGLEGNRPFLLERNYGRGKTILCTTIPTPAWTNMPLRRVFVTWIGQTVSYLAGGRVRPADWEVGRDLPLPAPDSAGDQPVRVRTPDGNTQISDIRLVGAQPQPYLPAAAVTLPGFYRVSSTDTVERVRPAAIPAPGQAGGDEGFDPHHQVVAVNVPRSESLPAVLDFERAAHDSGRWRVHRAEPPAPDAHADATAHALLTGRQVSLGLWDYLLWTVLALVLIEPLIANRLAGSTPGPNDTFGAVPATWRRRMRRWRTGLPWKTAATAGARSGAVSLKD